MILSTECLGGVSSCMKAAFFPFVLTLTLIATSSRGAIVEGALAYESTGALCEGWHAYDDSVSGPRPSILIAIETRNPHRKIRSKKVSIAPHEARSAASW